MRKEKPAVAAVRHEEVIGHLAVGKVGRETIRTPKAEQGVRGRHRATVADFSFEKFVLRESRKILDSMKWTMRQRLFYNKQT